MMQIAPRYNWTCSTSSTTSATYFWTADSTSITLPDNCKLVRYFDPSTVPTPPPLAPQLPLPPPRGFNLYLNAFDLLARFTEEAAKAGVRRGEFAKLPVELFVTWLILKSAEHDGVPPPEETPKQLQFYVPPHCLNCGRFITRKNRVLQLPYCGTVCVERKLARAS